MAHGKCYAICESKCKVETLSKEEILNTTKPHTGTGGYNEDTKVLTLIVGNNVHERVLNNTDIPQSVQFALEDDIEENVHSWFRFDKGMGVGFSGFFKMADSANGYSLKFLNQPNITNWTRIFVELFIDNKTVYIKVDGC